MARPAGFEPATHGLEGRCSIRLSYGRMFILTSRREINWSEMRDLNPRHPAPKAGALPDCANLRFFVSRGLPLRDAHITDFPHTRQHFFIAFFLFSLLLTKALSKLANIATIEPFKQSFEFILHDCPNS